MAKTIAIIGYGPGISSSVAEKWGAEGFSVALVARNTQKLQDGAKALEAKGVKTFTHVADVSDPESTRAAIQAVRSALGPITVLLWNAFDGAACGDLLTADLADVKRLFDVPVIGLLSAVREVLPDLKGDPDSALLVSNGSAWDIDPQMDAMLVGYSLMGTGVANAAKAKVVGLLAERLKAEGVYVGEVSVSGAIKNTPWGVGPDAIDPSRIADMFWGLYAGRTQTRDRIFPAS